jgi:hypothetical protein
MDPGEYSPHALDDGTVDHLSLEPDRFHPRRFEHTPGPESFSMVVMLLASTQVGRSILGSSSRSYPTETSGALGRLLLSRCPLPALAWCRRLQWFLVVLVPCMKQ